MPLDTHTSRICRYLGLTARKSNDLKTVVEVTDSLRELDPEDPLRYDFAICHLGMSKQCIHRWSPDHCPTCPIEPVCQIAAEAR
jgi:endonuclease III